MNFDLIMRQKLNILIISFLVIPFFAVSQGISVKSFKYLSSDQTARIHKPVIDQNGDKCALIKVVTSQEGFVWEGGTLGISKVEKKTGEYWVYLPHGSKKITIKHDQLGVLRNYIFPKPIKEANVYEMVLATKDNRSTSTGPDFESVWLMINSTPESADIYINDVYYGQTPLQKKITKEKHNYRITKNKYKPRAGVIDLSDVKDKKKLNIELKPDFGSIKVSSEPEEGAKVYIDDNYTGKMTPCKISKISSGKHRIQLRKELYEPKSAEFSINAGKTKSLNIDMNPVYGTVTIQTNPKAKIWLDNEIIGEGSHKKKLTPGVYKVAASKEKYYDATKNVKVEVGKEKKIHLNPQPKYGNLNIVTEPWEAKVMLNGKKYGTTPITIDSLFVGEHELLLKKEGYKQVIKKIEIKEGKTYSLKESLNRMDIHKTKEDNEKQLDIEEKTREIVKTQTKKNSNNSDIEVISKTKEGSLIVKLRKDKTERFKKGQKYLIYSSNLISTHNSIGYIEVQSISTENIKGEFHPKKSYKKNKNKILENSNLVAYKPIDVNTRVGFSYFNNSSNTHQHPYVSVATGIDWYPNSRIKKVNNYNDWFWVGANLSVNYFKHPDIPENNIADIELQNSPIFTTTFELGFTPWRSNQGHKQLYFGIYYKLLKDIFDSYKESTGTESWEGGTYQTYSFQYDKLESLYPGLFIGYEYNGFIIESSLGLVDIYYRSVDAYESYGNNSGGGLVDTAYPMKIHLNFELGYSF